MLDDAVMTMLPAKDLARAKAWYAKMFGFEPDDDRGELGAVYNLGGTRIFLYATGFAGTAQHTLLTFETDDLLADMEQLRGKGVTFLDYDLPGLKTTDGVARFGEMKTAWCHDSEGNILGFNEGM